MSQISKCPKVTVILSYWEASGEVSKLRYKSLLYCTSVGSYCSLFMIDILESHNSLHLHTLGEYEKKKTKTNSYTVIALLRTNIKLEYTNEHINRKKYQVVITREEIYAPKI